MSGLFSEKNILVVDDEPDLREILRDELEFAGATVAEAENGQQALLLAKAQKFDAIISDIRMPGGDGLTLAKNIKGQEGTSPVMFLVTGFADVAPAEAFDMGIEGFVYKPFNLGPMMENLSRALLDSQQRWSQAVKIATIKKLPVTGTFAELLSKNLISIGLGGMFIRGNFSEIRAQDAVTFSLADSSVFTGIVRWIQYDTDNKSPASLGLEFLNLNESACKFVNVEIARTKTKSYIPRK